MLVLNFFEMHANSSARSIDLVRLELHCKPEGNENLQCPILPSFVIMTTPSTPLMALIRAIVSSTSVTAAVIAIVVIVTRV